MKDKIEKLSQIGSIQGIKKTEQNVGSNWNHATGENICKWKDWWKQDKVCSLVNKMPMLIS